MAVSLALAAPAGADDFSDGKALGKAAYEYGFPLLENLRTRAQDLKSMAPVNRMANARNLATADDRSVVAPNADTNYSLAQIDLNDGPVILRVPKMDKRYWVFEFLEPYTNVEGYIGRRLNGSAGGTWAIRWTGGPSGGKLPAGVKTFNSSSRRLWMIGRTLVNGKKDLPKVRSLMGQYRLGTLAELKANKLPKPLSLTPGRPFGTQPTGLALLRKLRTAIAENPPPQRDAAIIAQLQAAGIAPGGAVASVDDIASQQFKDGLADGVDEAAAALKTETRSSILKGAITNGGWFDAASTIGDFGVDYGFRARVALVGLGANTPIESVYPVNLTDSDGHLLQGPNKYRMVFPKGQLPPVKSTGFWSITLYDSAGFLIPNKDNIYSVGPWHPPLRKKADGSVVIVMQPTKPTEKDVNWLASPKKGTFRLIGRFYTPQPSILDGSWQKPSSVKVG